MTIASRSPSRLALTSSSGRPRWGSRTWERWGSRSVEWGRCNGCRPSPRWRRRRSGAPRPTRPPARGGRRAAAGVRLRFAGEALCTGEPGGSLAGVRSRIEDGLGVVCVDHAGLTEAGPFGDPCLEGHGLHVDENEFVCEILDADLSPTAQGERGELVITPLRLTGFPAALPNRRFRDRHRRAVPRRPRWPLASRGHRRPDRRHGGCARDERLSLRDRGGRPPGLELRRVPDITFYTERSGMDEVKLEVELTEGTDARRLQETMRQQLGLRVRVVPDRPRRSAAADWKIPPSG